MKNINDLINKEICLSNNELDIKNFFDAKNLYIKLKKEIMILEKRLGEIRNTKDFQTKFDLYRVTKTLLDDGKKRKSNNVFCGNVNIAVLKDNLLCLFNDLKGYLILQKELTSFEHKRHLLLSKYITFESFTDGYSNKRCSKKHYFIHIDNELKCAFCGTTTKDYYLDKDDIDFLVDCAKEQGLLLDKVTKERIPLLELLIEEFDEYMDQINILNHEEQSEMALNYALWDNGGINDIKGEIFEAERLDKLSKRQPTDRSIYFKDEKLIQKYLQELDEEKKKINESSSNNKKLLLELCLIAKYEVLILTGQHIPTLYQNCIDEEERIAFIKAYYYLSTTKIRVTRNYFFNNLDSAHYKCRTTNQEINENVLKLKVK